MFSTCMHLAYPLKRWSPVVKRGAKSLKWVYSLANRSNYYKSLITKDWKVCENSFVTKRVTSEEPVPRWIKIDYLLIFYLTQTKHWTSHRWLYTRKPNRKMHNTNQLFHTLQAVYRQFTPHQLQKLPSNALMHSRTNACLRWENAA